MREEGREGGREEGRVGGREGGRDCGGRKGGARGRASNPIVSNPKQSHVRSPQPSRPTALPTDRPCEEKEAFQN